MLVIRLPPEIEAELTALAKRTGRTKTFYVRQAILNYSAVPLAIVQTSTTSPPHSNLSPSK